MKSLSYPPMDRAEFALALLNIQAVQFGAFRLKHHLTQPDAPLSPIYLNFRILRSYPEMLAAAAECFQELIEPLDVTLLADIPTAVTPIISVLSYRTGLPMISPRPEKKKSYGLENTIDGAFQPGSKVALCDDLITRASSKLEALSVLTEAGLKVEDIVVLVDREQGGGEELARHGCRLHTIYTLTELLRLYVGHGKLAEAKADEVLDYIRNS